MEIAELLQCSLDFIERPEVELQNYLNEIISLNYLIIQLKMLKKVLLHLL